MKDIDFIKNFSKITIKGSCKRAKVDRANLWAGRVSDDKVKKVREEIEHQVAKLYLKEEENDGKQKNC